MGHQHHFLSRLDRVSLPHVELALSLYNDPGLVLYLLGEARIPEAAERVALSLDHPERGPFLVVTRDGHFVTCLGEGMSPGDRPVVSRGQLDAFLAKARAQRSRLSAAADLARANGGGVRGLLSRLYDAGDDLSREEMVALSALQPLYPLDLVRLLFGAAKDLDEARHILLPELPKSERLAPQFRGAARAYWNTFWAVGHLSVLSTMGGWGPIERVPEIASKLCEQSYSWGAVRQGMLPLALKGIWATARLGKVMLPGSKRRFSEAISILETLDAGMSLAALGLRHARLRAEILKALEGGPAPDGPLAEYTQALAKGLVAAVEIPLEETHEMHRTLGARAAVRAGASLPKGSPYRFERDEDVPESLAMTLAVNIAVNFLRDGRASGPMFVMLPWVARAAPEDLYLPRDYIKATRVPWQPRSTYDLLGAFKQHYKHAEPPRDPAAPARKGPCPCGSGKKYKRCCGAGTPTEA